jgi:hypothetical protein
VHSAVLVAIKEVRPFADRIVIHADIYPNLIRNFAACASSAIRIITVWPSIIALNENEAEALNATRTFAPNFHKGGNMRVVTMVAAVALLPFGGATPVQAQSKPIILAQERHEEGERRERCERLAEELRHIEAREHEERREGDRGEAHEQEERAERVRHEYREHRCEELERH